MGGAMSTDYNNTGSLNPAKEKRSDKSPDWYGKLMVSGEVLEALKQGKQVRISGWERDGKYGQFISLKVSLDQPSERNEEKQSASEAGQPWPSTGPQSAPPRRAYTKPGTIEGNLALKGMDPDAPFDDDIPF
jgi:hypothetical protein